MVSLVGDGALVPPPAPQHVSLGPPDAQPVCSQPPGPPIAGGVKVRHAAARSVHQLHGQNKRNEINKKQYLDKIA